MPALSAALATALEKRQREVGAGAAAERSAALLGAGARCVVTGQQPGLLGGPLLVLHKAAGAIEEARRRSTPARPVVPVFWVASDDHDWGEVNRATVMDATGHPRALSLDLAGDGRSVRDVPVPEAAVRGLFDALAKALPAGEHAREALTLATPPVLPTDVGTWFAVTLARLVGDAGLLIVEPHVLSPFAGEVFASFVRFAEAIGEAVRAAGASQRAAGLEVALEPKPSEAPFFLRDEPSGRRRRVSLDGERVLVRGSQAALDRETLEDLVRREPALASADVVGRVLLQDALLPVDAYVAGPNEARYLAQVAPAHAVLELSAPEVIARPSATWVERGQSEALVAAGLDVDAVLRGEPPRYPESLALDDRGDDKRKAAGRAIEALRPRNKPQERVLSPLSIVARCGVERMRALLGDVGSAPRDPARPTAPVI